jgi:hypothetical protein
MFLNEKSKFWTGWVRKRAKPSNLLGNFTSSNVDSAIARESDSAAVSTYATLKTSFPRLNLRNWLLATPSQRVAKSASDKL